MSAGRVALLLLGSVPGLAVGLGWGTADGVAQGPTEAAVRGVLLDARGVPLPAAEVRLRRTGEENAQSGAGLVARTGRGGEFVLLGMAPGVYAADVLLPGAMSWLGSQSLRVEAGQVGDVELRVKEGAGGLAVRVAFPDGDELATGGGEAGPGGSGVAKVSGVSGVTGATGARALSQPEQEAGSADAAGTLSALPLPERQWESVEALTSAAVDTTVAGGGSAQDAVEEGTTAAARSEGETGSAASGLSYDGLPATQNAQTVDGLSEDQAFSGGPRGGTQGNARIGSSFAQGAVASVRVMPHSFSAQSGGAGGVVTVTSRGAESGLAGAGPHGAGLHGAGLHGTGFAQTRQSAWAAVNPFSVVTHLANGEPVSEYVRPGFSDGQGGLAVGMPVRLGNWRAGLFGAAELQERAETLFSSPETSGFYALSATQRALLGNRGVSVAATGAALAYLDSLTGEVVARSPRVLGFGRLDAQPGRADRVSLGAQVQGMSSPATGGSGVSEGVVNSGIASIGTNEVRVEAYTAGWQHAFGSRASNGLRLQFAHDLQYETASAPAAQEPAIGPGGLAPQVSIEPEGFRYGTPATLGRVAYPDEQRMEAGDSLAVRVGRHLLTVGGDWSRVHERVLSATNLEGAFSYDSDVLNGHAGGLVDWITDYTFNVHAYPNGGCPSVYASVHYFCFRSYSQSFTGAATEFVTHEVAGFGEDSVRLGRDLLLQFGVRYDYLLMPFPQTPNAALDAALAGVGGPAAGVTASFPEDRNNVGPRMSAAWAPGGRRRHWMSVQAGYGFFYGRLPGATIDAALANTGLPTTTTSVRIVPTTEVACPQVASQGFGYPCAFSGAPTGVVGRTTAAVVFSNRFRLPATQRGMFAVERELGRRLLLRGEYATAWTTQLPETLDLNVAPSTTMKRFVIEGGAGQPGLSPGQTFQVPLYTARRTPLVGPVTALVSNANATYHSGTAEVRLRDFHGWSARGSYTFSRAIDDGPLTSAAPRQNGQFDPFSDGYDKGLSSFQRPQHISGDVTFRSALREGPVAVRALFSGWRMAAIGTAGSGAPYSYVVFGGTRLTGGRESINGSGGATYLPTVGRNTLRLPGRGVANLRLAREVPVRGAVRLQMQADAFNVLNSVSLSRVETRAFVLGTPAVTGGPTPLVFQDAAAIAAEGLTTPAFGTPLSSTSGTSRERQVELGVRLSF